MDIIFASHQLTSAATNYGEASRLFGSIVGRKYIQRIAVLRATGQFSELFGHQALRLHPLKENRSGQFALTLTGNYRLIIEKPAEDQVRILAVEDHHGN